MGYLIGAAHEHHGRIRRGGHPIDTLALGDRSYLAHDGSVALVIDPQRDIDRVLALAAARGVRITHVFETHLHNDYVTGGLALARLTGAAYHVNAADPVAFGRVAVRDGDVIEVSPVMGVRALATPGHTFTHLSYVLQAVRRSVRCSAAGRCSTGPLIVRPAAAVGCRLPASRWSKPASGVSGFGIPRGVS